MEIREWEEIQKIDGKDYPVKITKMIGHGEFVDDQGRVHEFDQATYIDYGPKLGISRVFTKIPKGTPEEHAAGRARLMRTCWDIIDRIDATVVGETITKPLEKRGI